MDIYGKVKRGDSKFVPFLYQGQYYDEETDLAYNRFRYYSPDTGMYISQDPIGLAGNNPNFYAYVYDSNSEIDPFGLECTPKNAQKKVKKGQGPKEIGRIDAPEQSVPGSQWHAHGKGKNKGAINIDGSIHDSDPKFSNKTKKWLKEHGWDL